jgi:hypothetical protein
MMRPGLGIGMDGDSAGPQLLGAGAGPVDGGRPRHARRLRGVGVERVPGDDFHAMGLPVDRPAMRVGVIVSHRSKSFPGQAASRTAPHSTSRRGGSSASLVRMRCGMVRGCAGTSGARVHRGMRGLRHRPAPSCASRFASRSHEIAFVPCPACGLAGEGQAGGNSTAQTRCESPLPASG